MSGVCTHLRRHQHKLTLILSVIRAYARELRLTMLPSPMFQSSRDGFSDWLARHSRPRKLRVPERRAAEFLRSKTDSIGEVA